MEDSVGMPVIHNLGDLMYAVSRATTQEDRLTVITRATYQGLGHRLPANWNPNGTLKEVAP